MRSRVYVAGPISLGDRKKNVQRGIEAGLELLRRGYAPFIPQLSTFCNGTPDVGGNEYEQWMELDFSYISVCQALLRLSGKSAGAEREVTFALEHGIPVYTSIELLAAEVPPSQ